MFKMKLTISIILDYFFLGNLLLLLIFWFCLILVSVYMSAGLWWSVFWGVLVSFFFIWFYKIVVDDMLD